MKLCLPVALVALVATLLHSTEYAAGNSICPEENCVEFDKCEESIRGDDACPASSDVCCSILRKEYRTHCRHHGGECMDKCNVALQRSTVDCPADQVCCVLV
ncbi:uncharacterized protein LOC143211886 [Lasioglossum baleicum]|uniref:uncharacterized protein LOC143211886 n=1 Tax=Lasioglossum baleicum TaxID=434251 RepID=UPI003FCD45A1